MTPKQRLGVWLVPRLPVNSWVFQCFRRELNAFLLRLLNRLHPGRLVQQRMLRRRSDVLVNLGCGPFGEEGWVNFDLAAGPGVTMRIDCRYALPLADGAARGIHVEHYFEHLEPRVERPRFLAECRRCLAPGGILRIIVPDVRKYVEAYLTEDWTALNALGWEGRGAKMEALNHVLTQEGEHYGGFDAEYLRQTLQQAGFGDVREVGWRQGSFPGGPIDREEHRRSSLYMEAHR
jgi:hypothetical protein